MNSPNWTTDRGGAESSEMDKWKRPARGLDEISSVFLSSPKPPHAAQTVPEPSVSTTPGPPPLFPIFCCLRSSPAVESFFTAGLCVEIARNNQAVALIDFGFERSVIRHLMQCWNPLRDILPTDVSVRPDYRLESMRFCTFSEITLVSPAVPGGRKISERTLERIFSEDKVRKCDAVLINSPPGSHEVSVPETGIPFRRTAFFVDVHTRSLARAYSWIKKLSPGCRSYLIGVVSGGVENGDPVPESVSRLQRTIFKYMSEGPEVRVVSTPMDLEGGISMQSGEPLAAMGTISPSRSVASLSKFCRNFLRNE